jgi:FKBP-type peptidyl-prolyl cis-trans isomerase FklB
MKLIPFFVFVSVLFATKLHAQNITIPPPSTADLDAKKVLYSLGVMLAEDMKKAGLEKEDKSPLMKGIEESLVGTNTIDLALAKSIVQKYKAAVQSKSGVEYLANNSKKSGVIVLPSGIQYEIITSGPAGGAKPKLTDKVTTHYHGTLIDGKVFDSSVNRGQPSTFPLNGVIKGWQEALQLMSVGDKWKISFPYNLAYGERGSGTIPPYSTLIFEIELISINQ